MRRAFLPLLTLLGLLVVALPVQAHGYGHGGGFGHGHSFGTFYSPGYASAFTVPFAYPAAQLVVPVQQIYVQPQAIYVQPAAVYAQPVQQTYAPPQASYAPAPVAAPQASYAPAPVVQQDVLPVLAAPVVSYLQTLTVVDRYDYLCRHYGVRHAQTLHQRHFGTVPANVRAQVGRRLQPAAKALPGQARQRR